MEQLQRTLPPTQQLTLSPSHLPFCLCQTMYLQSSIKTSWNGHTASGCGSIGGDCFLQLLEATCRQE